MIREDGRYLIIYHGGCPDGFTSAWIAQHALKTEHTKIELFAAQYGGEMPKLEGFYDRIFVLDFGYDLSGIRELARYTSEVTWIDHHVSNEETMQKAKLEFDNVWVEYDVNRSGAGLTWGYFNAPEGPDDKPWWVVRYVQDRDIWAHDLWETAAVNAYLMTVPHTVEAFDKLKYVTVDQAAELGAVALETRQSYVDAVKKTARRAMVATCGQALEFVSVNATYHWGSDVCAGLLEDYPSATIACYWFQQADGQFKFGLRSREGGPDVSKICANYGGGGHEHAAGFLVKDRKEFPV